MKGDGFLFTSESVTEGHPDKVADQISDYGAGDGGGLGKGGTVTLYYDGEQVGEGQVQGS